MKKCAAILFLFLGSVSLTFSQTERRSEAPGIRDLAWLIGRWEFVDRAVSSGDPYQESGVRECNWALDEQYIRCESRATVRGKVRTYVFYLNWNNLDNRFEMVALFGNYGRKTFYTITLSEQGRRLELLSERTIRNGVSSQSWATIRYDGQDKMSWETRINRGNQPPDAWPLLYRDEAQRLRARRSAN